MGEGDLRCGAPPLEPLTQVDHHAEAVAEPVADAREKKKI